MQIELWVLHLTQVWWGFLPLNLNKMSIYMENKDFFQLSSIPNIVFIHKTEPKYQILDPGFSVSVHKYLC